MNATMPLIDRNLHNEVNFRPEEYEVLDYLDNSPPRISDYLPTLMFGASQEQWSTAMATGRASYDDAMRRWRETMDHYFPDRANNNPSIRKCTHCGNVQVRYIAAVKHVPTGQVVVFGDICVDRLGFANRDAFRAAQVRARAQQGHARLAIFRQREAFLARSPQLAAILSNEAEMTHPDHANNEFARDIVAKLNQYGSLSDRQVECFVASVERDHVIARQRAERAAQEAARRASAQPAPEGRVTVEGQVVGVKQHDVAGFGYYNRGSSTILKMTLLLDNGSKVWMTVPGGVDQGIRGKRVRVTATFTRSSTDQSFAFGKRPSGLEVLESMVAA
jgi:hypothetical protein